MNREYPLISVIIPVYNVEPYLERCLESVVRQSYTNLEIILVDDGSTDQSGSMCDIWAGRDSRIQAMHKENAGLGMARNTGIDASTGEYLTFVDSDDYVEQAMVETLFEALKKQNSKVCYGGCIDVDGDGTLAYGKPPSKLTYSGEEEIAQFIGDALSGPPEVTAHCFTGMSAWGNLYAASFFREKGVRFLREQKVLCEDIFYNITICRHVDKVVIAPHCLYYYCANEGTLTKRYRADRFEAAKNMRELLREELAEELPLYPFLSQRIERNYMDNLILCMRQEIVFRRSNGYDYCRNQLRKILEDEITRRVLQTYPVSSMEMKQRILFTLVKQNRRWMVYWLFRIRYGIG